jgi:hypothetical protein
VIGGATRSSLPVITSAGTSMAVKAGKSVNDVAARIAAT